MSATWATVTRRSGGEAIATHLGCLPAASDRRPTGGVRVIVTHADLRPTGGGGVRDRNTPQTYGRRGGGGGGGARDSNTPRTDGRGRGGVHARS